MRVGWSEHQEVARVLAGVDLADRGTALALLGAAMLMLAQDLLLQDASVSVVIE